MKPVVALGGLGLGAVVSIGICFAMDTQARAVINGVFDTTRANPSITYEEQQAMSLKGAPYEGLAGVAVLCWSTAAAVFSAVLGAYGKVSRVKAAYWISAASGLLMAVFAGVYAVGGLMSWGFDGGLCRILAACNGLAAVLCGVLLGLGAYWESLSQIVDAET